MTFVVVSVAPALAQNAAAGEKDFIVCRACHQIGPTAKNAVGPVLNGVVGRKAGTYAGYNYSPANKDSGITWTPEELDKYLTSPQTGDPAHEVIFPGLKDLPEEKGCDPPLISNSSDRTARRSGNPGKRRAPGCRAPGAVPRGSTRQCAECTLRDMRGDRVHQRRRQAVIGLQTKLLEPRRGSPPIASGRAPASMTEETKAANSGGAQPLSFEARGGRSRSRRTDALLFSIRPYMWTPHSLQA